MTSEMKFLCPKDHLVTLTGDRITAMLLDLFMYWSYWSLWVGDPEIPVVASQGWVERSPTELKDDLMIHDLPDFRIQNRLNWLVLTNFFTVRLSDSGQRQYRAAVYTVMRDVFKYKYGYRPVNGFGRYCRYPPPWWREQDCLPSFGVVPNDLYALTHNNSLARLLELYMYWSYWSLWVGDPAIPLDVSRGWIQIPLKDMQKMFFPHQSVSGLQQWLNTLVQVGFLEDRLSDSGQRQYRAAPYVVKRGLFQIGQLDEFEYFPVWWHR